VGCQPPVPPLGFAVGLAGGLVFVGKAIIDGAKNTKIQKY